MNSARCADDGNAGGREDERGIKLHSGALPAAPKCDRQDAQVMSEMSSASALMPGRMRSALIEE